MRIGEAATGIGEQMADTGLAIQRAKDKTEQMQARASAIDELTTSGALEDFTSDQTQLDRELGAIASKSQVDTELEQMKAELGSGSRRSSRRAARAEHVIVRLMGEGQFEIDDEVREGLNELDEQAERRSRRATRRGSAGCSERWPSGARRRARACPTTTCRPPTAIVPPPDLTLEEARELFDGEGLIPDLPAA